MEGARARPQKKFIHVATPPISQKQPTTTCSTLSRGTDDKGAT